jgi:hypothetical protein
METTEADIRATCAALFAGRITVSQCRDWILAIALPPIPDDPLKRSLVLLLGARNRLAFWMDGVPESGTRVTPSLEQGQQRLLKSPWATIGG